MITLHTFSRMRLREQRETWKALCKIRRQYSVVDVSVSGVTDYDSAVREFWGRDDLIIIEQDIVPSCSQIRALENCVCDWCAYRYRIRYMDNHDPAYWVTHGLGFTKFNLELQKNYPAELWFHRGNWSWRNLDSRITGLMVQSGLAPHIHGDVKHNRIADWTGLNENGGLKYGKSK
jgi:hypothetical protein